MPGQHQIHPGRLLSLVIMRLMVHDNTEFIRIQSRRQFFHGCPRPSQLLLHAVLSSDQIETIVQQYDFILQYNHIVLLQLCDQIIPAVTPVCLIVISLVMISERIIHTICSLQRAQGLTGGDHIFF